VSAFLSILIFLADRILIDKVILVVENRAYTLFDLKKHCILTSIVEGKGDWKSCGSEDKLKSIFPEFLSRAILLENIGGNSKKIEDADVKEVLEKAKETGLKEEDVEDWLKDTMRIKEYVQKSFKGKKEILKEYVETLKKTMRIRIYF
jgi:hypothetical protein